MLLLSTKVKSGDVIEFFWEDNVPDDILPENIPLKIIYEDETIKIFYDNKFLQTSDGFTDKVLDICSKYLSEDALFKIAVLYDYLGVIKY